MRQRRSALLAALVLALAGLAAAPGAQASFRAGCIPGQASYPTCTWWNAKVTFIADGDTVDARISGGRERHIRFTGINAMELQRYSKYADRRLGDCHGVEATALVERYVKGSHFKVRLAAQQASSRSGERLRRSVWVRSGGRWKDLAKLEIAAGQALWLPAGDEWAHNLEYAGLASKAMATQQALYDPDFCGAGPEADLPIGLAVNWDADGTDERNLDGEWVDIRNGGRRPLGLGGWFFRDSFLRYDAGRRAPGYVFPASAVVPAGGSIRLRMGCGRNTSSELHWCQHGSVFENVTGGPRHLGDGGYLFDPQRDLRASTIYPCVVACGDPLTGRVRVTVHPDNPESIGVTNISGAAIDLADHTLKLRNHAKAGQYVFGNVFGPGTVLAPGRTLRYVPARANALSDRGGVVELRTLTDLQTGCADWGFGRC